MQFKQIPVDKVQQFWDKNPCNVRHSPSKIGTKKYFAEVEKRKYFVEPHIPKFAEFQKWKGKKVLEIGCGIGTDTISFARAGAQVAAVEISKKSLELAKKRAKVYGLQNKIQFYLANAEELSKIVPVEPYVLIYSFGVIHHTPHPEKVIAEIKKYTHKNTIIKIMIYHRFAFKVLWILLKFGKGAFWKLDELIANHSEAATGSPVTYVYSKAQAKKLLRDFKIIDMKVDHIFPYSIPDYRKYRYKKVLYFRLLPKALFHLLETRFGWHLLITAKVKEEKKNYENSAFAN